MKRQRPRARRGRRLLAVLLAASVGLGFVTTRAFTAANVVPVTNISQFTQAITPAQLEPAECSNAGVTVTTIVAGSGAVTSTASNQLVLGSSGVDTLSDNSFATDCMVGGASVDTFNSVKNAGDLCIVSTGTASNKYKNCTLVATRP